MRLKSLVYVGNALDRKVVRIAYPVRVQASCVIGSEQKGASRELLVCVRAYFCSLVARTTSWFKMFI